MQDSDSSDDHLDSWDSRGTDIDEADVRRLEPLVTTNEIFRKVSDMKYCRFLHRPMRYTYSAARIIDG